MWTLSFLTLEWALFVWIWFMIFSCGKVFYCKLFKWAWYLLTFSCYCYIFYHMKFYLSTQHHKLLWGDPTRSLDFLNNSNCCDSILVNLNFVWCWIWNSRPEWRFSFRPVIVISYKVISWRKVIHFAGLHSHLRLIKPLAVGFFKSNVSVTASILFVLVLQVLWNVTYIISS